MSPGSVDEIIAIDVRSKDEWDTDHVRQAIHVPYAEIADRVAEVSDNKDVKIVVSRAVGGRA